MSHTPQELHLIHTLSERFDVWELHRALVGLSDEAPLKARLMVPSSVTPLAFASHAVSVLTAAGLVDRALFAALVAQRQTLAGELWGVAALFGVSHPDAVPVEGLPDHFAALVEAHAALRTFVGRAEQLELLRVVLLPPSGPARPAFVCNLQGMAGVGKSFLIDRFYADHLTNFPGGHLKITLGHDAAPTADTLLSELAERLGVLQGPGRVEDRVRGAAMAARPLLHIDNLDAEAQAEAAVALVRRLSGVPIVLSGRYHFGRATPGWRLVPVAPFSVSDALAQLQAELVAEVAARVNDADRLTLVGALGGLPLAIHLAASYLNAGYEVGDFLAALAASGLSLKPFTASDTAYLDRAERALHATFELSLKALCVELGSEADAGLPAVAALGVAPLSGVGRSWLDAIVGAPSGKAIRWVSLAVKLGIVQHDLGAGRWRVHKLLAEHLRHQTDAEAATARMDAWVMERLPAAPDDTRGTRWGALRAEHEAVAEWVAGLDGARAVEGGWVGFEYASASGPYAAWLGALARGLDVTADTRARSALLLQQGRLALQAGDLDLAVSAAYTKSTHDAAHGWDREVALAAGLRADVLQARGQLDEALRIRREEELPVYKRLGDVHQWAIAMGKIADVLQVRGQFEEALRIRRDEQLPIFEALSDVQACAVTIGQIADVLEIRGQLDQALRLRREEELPVYQRFGCETSRAATIGKIASVLKTRGQFEEALRLWRDEELPIYVRLGDVLRKALTMGKIADVLQAQGHFDDALRIRREEELPVFERLSDIREKAITMGKIADILQVRGQFNAALQIRQNDELPVFEQLGDVYEKAVTLSKIAEMLQAQGRTEEALKILQNEVMPVFERLGDMRSKAITLGKISDALQSNGQFVDALRLRREQELPVYERLGDVLSKAVTMGKIADILELKGQIKEALRIRREEELPVYTRLRDLRRKVITMDKIANMLHSRGQTDEALRMWRNEVLPGVALLGDVESKARTLNKIADVLLSRRQFDKAQRIWREELPIHEALGDRQGILVIQTNIAITLLHTRKPEHILEALALLTTALRSAVELNFPVEAEQVRDLFRQLGLPPPH